MNPALWLAPHTTSSASSCPIFLVHEANLSGIEAHLKPEARQFLNKSGFVPKPGQYRLLPDEQGNLTCVVMGIAPQGSPLAHPFAAGELSTVLPEGNYHFAQGPETPFLTTLGWVLNAYRFSHYKNADERCARLVPPDGVDVADLLTQARGVVLGRELINMPANACGPDQLEGACRTLASRLGAAIRVIKGEELLENGLRMIHAVGRASAQAPRLVDFSWQPAGIGGDLPKVTLVGKGVTFDTGGLNLKPDSAMLLMKKDMGGAASVLALAQMVMEAQLPVRLRVLIPIVENAVSGLSFRPGDVLHSYKGLQVEIGNTDAEGRLILADALTLADEDAPDLMLDFATLTGAARVALGPELPPFYTKDEGLREEIMRHGQKSFDPVWPMPLWESYQTMLDSKIADLNHIASGPFAGSIIAALFLSRFVEKTKTYVHFDIYGWNPSSKPGRPEGGEPQGARLAFALLQERYKKS
jgi:leucyl aminopeptidase